MPLIVLCRGKGQYGANSPKRPFDPSLPRYIRITDISSSGRLIDNDPVSIPIEKAEKYLLEEGDVLIARSGNTVGKSYVHHDPGYLCAYAGYLIKFQLKHDQLLPDFVRHFLQSPSYWEWVNATRRAQAQPNINAVEYGQLPIVAPPLPEQRKIAAILSSVDDTIEKTEAVIEQLQVVKKAMMQELLTRGLPGRHTRFKKTEIGEVPEEWNVYTYGELAKAVPRAIQSGPFGSSLKHSEFEPTGKLVIGIDNVQDGQFSFGSNHRISYEKFRELNRFRARPLDLLITVMATVGRCCVVPEDIEDAIITKHVYRLTVDQTKADPFFLMYCVYGVPFLSSTVQGNTQGLSRPGLNKSLLLPLLFPIPPLKEQKKIVSILRSMDGRIEKETVSVTALHEVKKALMSVLLTGEVRVVPT